jgi:hypothetical protein
VLCRRDIPAPSPPPSPLIPSPTSPTSPNSPHSGSALLSSCISLLNRMTLLSCYHPVPSPRPSLPPLSLQNVTLDVAFILLKCVAGRPKEMAMVGSSVLAGFEGWGEGVKSRLLTFFHTLVVACMARLEQKRSSKGRICFPGSMLLHR